MAVEFLSKNKYRRYPFASDSNTGGLPDWVLLDIRLVNVSSTAPGTNRLSCVGYDVDSLKIVLHFAYTDSDGSAISSFDIPVDIGSDIKLGTLRIDDGIVVRFAVCGNPCGDASDLFERSVSIEADVLPTRIVELQKDRHLNSICGASGVIHLKDGYNTTQTVRGESIVVTVKKGTGLGNSCSDADDADAFDCSKALLFMNGQHADSEGNINIEGGPGVSVQTGRNAVVDGAIVPAIVIKASGIAKELT